MDPRAMRQKQREANEEAAELASSIAQKTGVDPSMLNVSHPDPSMAAMYRAEAMRDFLKELDAALGGGPAVTDLEYIDGIGPEVAQRLREADITTLDELREADDDTLLAVDGIGKASLKKIRSQL